MKMVMEGYYKQSTESTNCLDTACALFKVAGGDPNGVVAQCKDILGKAMAESLPRIQQEQAARFSAVQMESRARFEGDLRRTERQAYELKQQLEKMKSLMSAF